MTRLQRAISLLYPDQCLLCPEFTDDVNGLCGPCWRETRFLRGLTCNACGTSLPGQADDIVLCDTCLLSVRPWQAGRAAMAYEGNGRRLVLRLKHGDRTELAHPAAKWMIEAAHDILTPDTLLVPVPVHWSRLLRRRYNQSAELARAMAKQANIDICADGLIRTKRTPILKGLSVKERHQLLSDAIIANPKRLNQFAGRRICIVDDVMTSGATLTASTLAALDAGADQVFVTVLARVEKAP